MHMDNFLSPDDGLRRQAQAHLQARRWVQAQECLSILVALNPYDVWVWQWQVVVALALNRPEQAVTAAQSALAALPPAAIEARADVAHNLGQAHGLLGQHTQALQAFARALAWQPGHTSALLGSAKAHAALGQHAEAGRALTQLLAQEPAHTEALVMLGNALLQAGAVAKALGCFMRFERAQPAAPFSACMVVFLSRHLLDWRWPQLPVTAEEAPVLNEAVSRGKAPELALLAHRAWRGMPALEPFATLVLYDAPALQHHVAERYLRHLHPPVPPQGSAVAPRLPSGGARTGPIKVAYVSCEFMEHATSYLLAGVLARHNPARVQVYLLSFSPPRAGDEPDAMRRRLKGLGHTWVDIHSWSDAQVAQWCRDQEMDVAVDLKGLTRDARPGIFAHRAAPVQVNWLGYPGTLPAPYYDWILADAQVLPPDLEPHFAERVWRLPHSYQPNDPDRAIDPTPQRRADHGLPDQGVVLVCFNNSFKFTPEVWAIWMRLLQARPDAVLWLLDGALELRRNAQTHTQEAGVAPDRLVFAPRLPQAQHLARLQLADLSLDTVPYNAHTTVSDALWAGVPHVACTGESFAARVGASVLRAADMAELIAHGLLEYEALALRLVCDDTLRTRWRATLAERRGNAPLWDAAGFAENLETAYVGMCGA
jgi:protein O-GlcNAc transferase